MSGLKVVCGRDGGCGRSAAGGVGVLAHAGLFVPGRQLLVSSAQGGGRAARAEPGPCAGALRRGWRGGGQRGGTGTLSPRLQGEPVGGLAWWWWRQLPWPEGCQPGMPLPCVSARLGQPSQIPSCLGGYDLVKWRREGMQERRASAALLGREE